MKNLDDVLSGLPADRRQRIELRVKEILAEETASFAKPLAAAVLLKKAVNDSADECGPDCDDYAHGESCPACDPAKWLVDQQVEIERLQHELFAWRNTATLAQNEEKSLRYELAEARNGIKLALEYLADDLDLRETPIKDVLQALVADVSHSSQNEAGLSRTVDAEDKR